MKKGFYIFFCLVSMLWSDVLSFGEFESVRKKLSEVDLMQHLNGEIRAGYINFDAKNEIDSKAFALGGHLHIKTFALNGLQAGAAFYTVQDFGLNEKNKNGDFFDSNKKSFAMLGEAYIQYTLKNTFLKVGRQIIDTPHADSDDIRMVPNLFEGALLKNSSFENFDIFMIYIDKMAGWENGTDAKRFVKISDVLGVEKGNTAISILGAEYSGLYYLPMQIWFYNIDNVANIVYMEATYNKMIAYDTDISISMQLDRALSTGERLAGEIDTKTVGAAAEISFESIGLRLGIAYNREFGSSSSMFSFGGGPFFTSMEDQTIDAVADENAEAYTFGGEYEVYDNISVGFYRGEFKAGDNSVYHTAETDAYIVANLTENIEIESAFAAVDDKTQSDTDYNQFRMLVKYRF
ncbi:OprD family outer membrane porin [Nitrosophilus alvini]|uniref:OprD family outer membrane porin n=1 Tax=Nitrosophilus alvini TaxID=2714855 RepID=UPI00190BB802|nr:OprD family outer membrane porin [Nitrosophilus alvini]